MLAGNPVMIPAPVYVKLPAFEREPADSTVRLYPPFDQLAPNWIVRLETSNGPFCIGWFPPVGLAGINITEETPGNPADQFGAAFVSDEYPSHVLIEKIQFKLPPWSMEFAAVMLTVA